MPYKSWFTNPFLLLLFILHFSFLPIGIVSLAFDVEPLTTYFDNSVINSILNCIFLSSHYARLMLKISVLFHQLNLEKI